MADSFRREGAYAFGKFRLDPNRRVLLVDDRPVPLRPTVFDVLLYLVEHPLRVVSKDELLAAVWADRIVEESNLSQAVFWLRAALQEYGGGEDDPLIVTARGRGYRFTVEPTWVGVSTDGQASTGDAGTSGSASPQRSARWRWAALIGAGIALIVLIGAARHRFWEKPPRLQPGNAVILADFKNETRDPVFDHSLADVLRIDLGQSPFVNVVPDKRARETLALMKKPEDAPLTVPIADEVCVRRNANAVLAGGIAAFGSRYVLTLIATDCSGQQTLAAEKADVANRESVVPALDGLIAKVRTKLGEPVASVDQFNVPLAAEKTGSLDALKAYSEGVWMVGHGRRAEAIELEHRAIDLDPDFVMAYAVLGTIYYNIFDFDDAKTNIGKAYALRKNANERSQMRISVIYDQVVTRDFDAERQALAEGLALYPRDDANWANFANLEAQSGRFDRAIGYAQRSLAANPQLELAYSILARAELGAGRFAQGRAVGQRAVAAGLAGEATHRELMRVAWAMRDREAFDRERAWAESNAPATSMMFVEGEAAWSEGRLKDGLAIFGRAADLSKAQGVKVDTNAYEARLLVDLGLPEQARARLAGARDHEDADYIYTLAEIGDPATAGAALATMLHDYPSDTLLNAVFAPETRAALALRGGRAREAIDELQPALAYRSRSPEVDYLLGNAYLAAGDGGHAAAAFGMIRAHQGWYPETPLYALAELGLARALAMQRDVVGARGAYRAFLTDWRHADPDTPRLKAARSEYARLG